MKALAARSYADIDDIKLLCEMRAITDVREVEEICARTYPDEPLSDRSRIVIEDIVSRLEHEPTRISPVGPCGPSTRCSAGGS